MYRELNGEMIFHSFVSIQRSYFGSKVFKQEKQVLLITQNRINRIGHAQTNEREGEREKEGKREGEGETSFRTLWHMR